MQRYDHTKIEKKWQKEWEKKHLHKTPDKVKGKDNFYLLVEFPYPSGNLHVGHWYAFSVPDILARALRMQGKNVLYPIGFDAFGLPAENAAIKHKLNPRKWTEKNIAYMKKQIRSMGTSFDWSREVQTIDPAYYKWTQWQFLQFFKKGLAYQKDTPVNWCPSCKTVLANEQVVDGKCERCSTEVVQKNMLQWNLKITEYADRLVDDLERLDWPEQIKESQRNWIGRSEGAEIDFSLTTGEKLTVFTTRADTLFGATYMVLAPEHALVEELQSKIENWKEVVEYREQAQRKTELERQESREKTGVELQGVRAINPATGEEIPVYIADYVLATYGTGAIMAVPAHDERDFEFAKKFDLPIVEVVSGKDVSQEVYTGDGPLQNSGRYDGIQASEAVMKMGAAFGTLKKTYKMRDWIVSRQRYWGVPIPIIHCGACGAQAVPEKDLPVKLPGVVDYLPDGRGKSPLAKAKKWVSVKCPKCKGKAERETDTLDTFVDSSWYFLRYTDPKNKKKFADPKKLKNLMPVNLYSGGAEHTTMHVLYSRFWQKALFDLDLVKDNEPYTRRMNRSLILGPDGQKMSKSRGNVIDPDEVVARLGADTVRMYLAFIGPYNEVSNYPWNPDGVVGVRRFLERIWDYIEGSTGWKHAVSLNPKDEFWSMESTISETDIALNKMIKQVTEDIAKLKFNTAISAMMIFLNHMKSEPKLVDEMVGAKFYSQHGHTLTRPQLKKFLKVLAPFAPHITEELWHVIGEKGSIHVEAWPHYDSEKIKDKTIKIAVQVNGKTRAETEVDAEADKTVLEKAAREAAGERLEGKKILRVIVVPGRLVNFVIGA